MSTRITTVRPSRRIFAHRPCLVESFEPRVLLAIDVSVGVGTPVRSIVMTDTDGTVSTIRVAGGAATATFDGPVVSQTTSGGVSNVSAARIANLAISGTNPKVTIASSKTGDGRVALGGMSAAGPVNGVSGRGVVLSGTTTLSNGIGRLDLASAQGATISISRGALARLVDASVTVAGDVQDVSINSQQPLKLLRVGRWLAPGGGVPDQVTTLRINSLQSAGDFGAGVSLSGNGQVVGRPILGSARVLGALTGGNWSVLAGTGRVSAASVASNWSGDFASLGTFAVTGDLAGDVRADSIRSLTANTITGSNIRLDQPFAPKAVALNRLSARGAITNTDIRSDADIGTVTAASIAGSTIYAGVTQQGNPRNLPSAATAFPNATTIRSVTLRNRTGTPAFADTNIAAATLGKMTLGTINVTTGQRNFGLAALQIASVNAIGQGGAPIRAARLTDPAQSIIQGDFTVRIF